MRGRMSAYDILAAQNSNLVRVLPKEWIPDIPVWLTAPQELRSNPRIRAVFDHLAEQFIALINTTSSK